MEYKHIADIELDKAFNEVEDIRFEELTHDNYDLACQIDRSDVSEAFVDSISTIMENTDYGVEHGCLGHTFLVSSGGAYIGVILLGEAITWETDPPQVKREPFYRLMGFFIDKNWRKQGLGGRIIEESIIKVYQDFGERPIVLGCHKDNLGAARFYEKHGFIRSEYSEGNDIYYLRCNQKLKQ